VTFMRTRSGLKNLALFFKKDVTLYIEGRSQGGSGTVPDVQFYSSLLAEVRPNVSFKIKCVGNKMAVFDYLSQIEDGEISTAIVVVDRDTFGIDISDLASQYKILTYGYSWENDFWTSQTVVNIANTLSGGSMSDDWRKWLGESMSSTKRRMRYICALDISGRASGCSALLPKDRVGVSFYFNKRSKFALPASEVRRISICYRKSPASGCNVSRGVLRAAMLCGPERSIQGHLWERFSCQLLRHFAKSGLKMSKVDSELLRNIGLSIFRSDVKSFVGNDVLGHYSSELERCGL